MNGRPEPVGVEYHVWSAAETETIVKLLAEVFSRHGVRLRLFANCCLL